MIELGVRERDKRERATNITAEIFKIQLNLNRCYIKASTTKKAILGSCFMPTLIFVSVRKSFESRLNKTFKSKSYSLINPKPHGKSCVHIYTYIRMYA